VANPVSRSITANKVVWDITSTEVNLLSRILLRISMAEPKAKSKKTSPINPVEEEEKADAEVEVEPRSKKKKKTLGRLRPRRSTIHTYFHTMLLSLMIFLIRWMIEVFQPSLVLLALRSLIKLSEITEKV
jgi:hypothetical protein